MTDIDYAARLAEINALRDRALAAAKRAEDAADAAVEACGAYEAKRKRGLFWFLTRSR